MNASHSPSARVEILELRIAPAALVVLNVADSGAGSFRQALLDAEANGTSEPDTITFAIPSGPFTISPLTAFPVVSQGVTIDGTSQPGYSGSPIVQLDGAAIVASASGLQLSTDTVVKGLSITRFTGHGIDMTSASRVSVLGNWVGLDSLGNPAGNGGSGVYSGNVPSLAVIAIGGRGANEGNLLSGNARYGLETYSDYSGLEVVSNLIGTNPIGTSSVGNMLGGVHILGGTEIQDNVVAGNSGPGIYVNARFGYATISGNRVGLNALGGAMPNLGNGMTLVFGALEEFQAYRSESLVQNNTVSGNAGIGISLSARNTTVSSNTIGLSVSKDALVPNGGDGIRIVDGDAIRILSNTVSANVGDGIDIGAATDVRISTNFIGTNDAGLIAGNGGHGIKSAADTRYRQTFVQPYTPIPSHSSFYGNVLHNNGADGIAIVGGHTVLSANLLRNNAGLGIDLADNGSSANDANDSDTGPNDVLNTPTLSLGVQLPHGLRVDGTYHGLPATQFEIQVFSVQSVADEAGAYIGAFSITTDASGNASFSTVIPGVTVAGTNIVATASSGQNKTSEISLPASGILSGVSIADAQVWETNSGETVATVQVVRTNGFGTAAVNYTTASGTALAGSDFVAQSGTITFSDGETAKTIQILVTGDNTPELDESFSVILSNPFSAAIADGSGLVTIKNDDLAGVFSVQGGSVLEGDSNIDYAESGSLPFNVTLAQALGQPTTVNYSFGPQVGQLTFASGETSKTVWYSFFGDNEPEQDEVVYLNIISPFTGDQVARGFGTIVNNDTHVRVSGGSILEGGIANLTLTLEPPLPFQKSINYNATSNTATSGLDFQSASGTLMFAAGETTKTVSIQTNSDRATEGDETFFLDFSNSPRRATITLIDDLTGPTIDVSGGTVIEGDSGVANVLFTVTKSRESTHFVSVNYATLAGTAASGFDFDALSGVLVFAPGENSKTLIVRVFGDAVIEGDETFTLELSSPVDGIIGIGSATATISNDDVPPPLLSIADVSAAEGNGQTLITFTATLSAASLSTVTVDFAALGGTATSGVDFGIAGGTVTFAPGQTSRPVFVTVLGDSRWERDEEFRMTTSRFSTLRPIPPSYEKANRWNSSSPST
jgi:parallel beta-helix repeat protein